MAREANLGGERENPYRVTRWTVENGLPQSSIKALAQTPDGYLWVGTLRGLARFDGIRFKVFDRNNTPEMTHDSINDLVVDAKDGGLWIGTGDGLLYYRDHQFGRYGREQGVPGDTGHLCASPEGGVWFSPHPGQVARVRAGLLETWDFAPNDASNAVHQLAERTSSRILALIGPAGNPDAIFWLDLRTKSLTPLSASAGASPPSTRCFSFFQDVDGSFSVCTRDGVWRGSEKGWMQIMRTATDSTSWPQRFYRTRDEKAWVTQFESDGVSLQRLINGRLVPLAASEVSPNLVVSGLLEDGEGDLWVGTDTGLLRLEPRRIRVYSRGDGMRNDHTLAVAKGNDGMLWVGTREGVSGIHEGVVTNLPPTERDRGWGEIPVMLLDHENALWVGWPDLYLSRFREGRWNSYYAGVECGNTRYIKAIKEDQQGRMWIANRDRLLCNDAGHWTTFSTNNGLSSTDVRVIHQDRRGDLWFGSFGGGLNRLKDGHFTNYKTGRGELNNRAWWIHEDADGVFWVGSEDGLNRFVPPGVSLPDLRPPAIAGQESDGAGGSFSTFTKEQGLVDPVVNNIQEDDFGYLWLSGLRGIFRIPRQQLNDVAAGRRATFECVAYGEADGMLNSECNGGDNQPAGCKDDEGRICFPTVQGVAVIDPKEMRRSELPPPVVVEQVRANEEVLFGDGGPKSRKVQGLKFKASGAGQEPGLESADARMPRTAPGFSTENSARRVLRIAPGGARVLEIHYTANTLVAPERVRFKYLLEGHDKHWILDDQNRRVAFYTELRPGNYTFRVMACNSHGKWNEAGDYLSFHLAPHFYETWPFYVACGAFVLFAGLALHDRRIQRLRGLQRLDQERALHEERARIARDLHDQLGSDLTRIALEGELAARSCQDCSVANVPATLGGGVGAERPRETAASTPARIQALSASVREAFRSLDEMIWAVNPKQDTVAGLASYLCQFAIGYLRSAGIRCRFDVPSDLPSHSLRAGARHELFLVIKEGFHNIVKHAEAHEVHLRVRATDDRMEIELNDDGRGFNHAAPAIPPPVPDAAVPPRRARNGLANMRQRVEAIGGHLEIASAPGRGTRLTIVAPLQVRRR